MNLAARFTTGLRRRHEPSDRRRWLRGSLLVVVLGAAACGGSSNDGTEAGVGEGVDVDPQAVDSAEALGGITMRQQYGDGANQFGDLTVPEVGAEGVDGSGVPVIMLIHGGFWRTGFGLDLMEPLVPSLVEAGYAVWNVEYRRVGSGPEGGGGYPATFDDLAAAADALDALPTATRSRLDLDRVATVGHSAGGHLAVWLASRPSIPSGSRWSAPDVVPVVAVSQAGVLDLERCIDEAVGGTACRDLLLDGSEADITDAELSDRIGLTSPAALLPIDARVVAVHGTLDGIVPLSQSTQYAIDAGAVDMTVEVREIDGADHFDVIDPGHPAWQAVLDALDEQFGSG